MNKRLAWAVAFSVAASGCATAPEKIQTAYVSPLEFQNYDCTQIGAEMNRVSARAMELQGRLQKTADGDSAKMAVGLILFWPTLFFLNGKDGPEASEYARLKGEKETLEKLSVEKKCGTGLQTAAITPAAKDPAAVSAAAGESASADSK